MKSDYHQWESRGIHPEAAPPVLPIIVGSCPLLEKMVFSSPTLLFSTPLISKGYQKFRRFIEGVFALFFTAAGVKLLFSR